MTDQHDENRDDAAAAEAADVVAQAEAALASDASTQRVEGDIAELTKLAAERDEYLDTLRRLQADFDNYRKRTLKQQTETLERAAESLVMKLLEVLDTIDLARSHGEGDAIEPVAAKFTEVLEKEGLERIDPVGKPFDPNEHEAVAHEPGDGDPEVVGVMRAGYRWKGRVLRPAMVTVKG
ncbi:MAG: nucleotide exchange factor GrpE [Actinobacteria bacterium]|nr:nucleotide exchange factor GrpE [Actinomycetota bacterium]